MIWNKLLRNYLDRCVRVSRNRLEVVNIPIEAVDWSDNGNDSRLLLDGERNSLGIRMKQVEDDLLFGEEESLENVNQSLQ